MGILIFNLCSTAGKNERHKAPFSVLFHCLTSTVVTRLYSCHADQLHSAEKKLTNSMSIKYVLSFQMSPRATKFCITHNMLPASCGFIGPALTFVDGFLLDGSTLLYSFRVQTLLTAMLYEKEEKAIRVYCNHDFRIYLEVLPHLSIQRQYKHRC
jgi:hypothetical protein